jgi:hypothetical protein
LYGKEKSMKSPQKQAKVIGGIRTGLLTTIPAQFKLRTITAVLLCILITAPLLLTYAIPAFAAATNSITITKYAGDRTTIISQVTIDYLTMQSTLPVQGDGTTHYFHQGPSFDENNLWDPNETVNLKDKGAVKGTDVKDLCNLVGGMASGDTVQIKATDGMSKTFDFANVYSPVARQGKMVICWYTKDSSDDGVNRYYTSGAYVPDFAEGMQLVFLAQTTNTAGQYAFGNQDMHDCLPQNRWYYYDSEWPSTNGLSVKWISQVNIYSNAAPFWDLNGDHACNIGDVVKLGLKWGLTGSAGWIPEDTNKDGVINIGDVVKIGLNWGKTW